MHKTDIASNNQLRHGLLNLSKQGRDRAHSYSQVTVVDPGNSLQGGAGIDPDGATPV